MSYTGTGLLITYIISYLNIDVLELYRNWKAGCPCGYMFTFRKHSDLYLDRGERVGVEKHLWPFMFPSLR